MDSGEIPGQRIAPSKVRTSYFTHLVGSYAESLVSELTRLLGLRPRASEAPITTAKPLGSL